MLVTVRDRRLGGGPLGQLIGLGLVTGSPFLEKMREGGSAVPGIRCTHVVLQDHCALDFSEHVQIPSSPNAVRLVLPLNGFVLGT
ncbi:hypothetical protein ncot_00980 [Nocardioides sp. JQ2195]|uniref:hypothetical protein n=1 Tax=Nocardioides sp. JQ2195 TaxID=2592334 RepID=UPI00143ED19E|nr:hypothetical protein [Nocardioides sp. JQ2195]QIX25315.1 hypothetical protein ncot_00980 [Nocardioides sp. JQ2195]